MRYGPIQGPVQGMIRDETKNVPQGLKPSSIRLLYGTAEPVPFVQRVFPQPVKARTYPSLSMYGCPDLTHQDKGIRARPSLKAAATSEVQNTNPWQCDRLAGRGDPHKRLLLCACNEITCNQSFSVLKQFLDCYFGVGENSPECVVEVLHAFQSRFNTLISVENDVVRIQTEIVLPCFRVSKALYGTGEGLLVGHDAILAVRVKPARQIAGFRCRP
jgi:hypothetical protein